MDQPITTLVQTLATLCIVVGIGFLLVCFIAALEGQDEDGWVGVMGFIAGVLAALGLVVLVALQ